MVWKINGTPNTLCSAGDCIDITDLCAKKFNQFFHNTFADNVANGMGFCVNFNNNSNSVYAIRQQSNGGCDTTAICQTTFNPSTTNDDVAFAVFDVISIACEEKLIIYHDLRNGGNGVSLIPNRTEQVGKFVPSPDANITRIDLNNSGTSLFAVDSNMSALGTD